MYAITMSNPQSLDDLPEELAYLKQAARDIASQDVELLGCGEADLSTFENALRIETAGLTTAEAEIQCSRHLELIQDWLSRQESQSDPYILALHFLVGPLAAAYEVVSPHEDDADRWIPAFKPRMAGLELPEKFKMTQLADDILVTDGSTELFIREIDAQSYYNLTEEFSSPSQKTTTSDGSTVYPQSKITLRKATGTKHVVKIKDERLQKQITYFLEIPDGFVMVRLLLPEADSDETEFDAMLDSISLP